MCGLYKNPYLGTSFEVVLVGFEFEFFLKEPDLCILLSSKSQFLCSKFVCTSISMHTQLYYTQQPFEHAVNADLLHKKKMIMALCALEESQRCSPNLLSAIHQNKAEN